MKDYQTTANIIRALSILSTTEAGSGHPTSCMSAADIATVIFSKYFTYDIKTPKNPNNDRFILSKGHASPLLYALFSLSGAFKTEEMLTLRKFGSRLEGHPTPRFPYAEVTTGSLGQGLSVAAGIAYLAKLEKRNHKTYVLLGDGEIAEGQVYEASNFAAQKELSNLIAIADINGLGQTGKTAYFHNTAHYEKVFSSLGFETVVINGHDFSEIESALEKANKNTSKNPFMIVARTEKGKGVSFTEGSESYHGKPVKKEDLSKALAELKVDINIIHKNPVLFDLRIPKKEVTPSPKKASVSTLTISYKKGDSQATRNAFGEALAQVGKATPDIYVIDGDVGNSTYTLDFAKVAPERFIEAYIAEQNMVSVAAGLSAMGKTPFVGTFGAFLTRAADQIRMAAVSFANIKFVGSHAGVSIGEDGPSQMALEDIALFAPIPDSVILQPSDAVSCMKLVPEMVNYHGISYIRTLRGKTSVLYGPNDTFELGGSKTLKKSDQDVLTIVASGITLPEALTAYEALQKNNISIRVVDCYSIKPIDQKTLLKSIQETKNPIVITVEDHFIHGGLGDMVLSALAETDARVYKLGVTKISRSGSPEELLDDAGISSMHIVKTVKKLI